jgi:hypothetical protein
MILRLASGKEVREGRPQKQSIAELHPVWR